MFALYQLLINERFHLHTVTSGSFPAYSIYCKKTEAWQEKSCHVFVFVPKIIHDQVIEKYDNISHKSNQGKD